MSIRTATKTDVPAIAELVKSLAHYFLDDPGGTLPLWLEDTLTREAFLARISDANYSNVVFEESGSIAGYISVRSPGHLYHLFVPEEYQGKGISRSLWEYVRKQGQFSTFSVRSSIRAVPVYKRFGFMESGPVGTKNGISFQPMELHD